jgi:signal transduction histidine kinase/DNA-binding response OmpR family regulator
MNRQVKLRTRFLLLLSLVFVGGSVISAIALWNAMQQKAENEISERADILVHAMNSVRAYTTERIQPLLSQQLEQRAQFISETVPAFSARTVFENFRKQPEFSRFFYKEATLNPTNQADLVDDFERGLVEKFRADTSLKSLDGFRLQNGVNLFYSARPLAVSKPGCLRCHSTPDQAPKSQIATYGAEHGFGWKLGEIVSAQVVYVPAAEVFARGRSYLWLVLGIFLGIFTLAIWLINRQLRRAVIEPLQHLSNTANVVAKGTLNTQQLRQFDSTEMGVVAARGDETGALARSFQAMAHEVAAREQNLANAVEERTAQLAASMAQAKQARSDAEEANSAKSQFLANMSHELRTPLNAIIGYSEMLREEAEDAEQGQFIGDIDKITTAGRHLLMLVNDILDLSRIEAGKVEIYLEPIDLNREIGEVASTVQPLMRKNGNQLIVQCAPNFGLMQSDLTKLRQVLFNLLSNAAKFTDHGNVYLIVDMHPEHLSQAAQSAVDKHPSQAAQSAVDKHPDPQMVRFQVVDSGIGMNAEQLSRMFQTFSQADASTTRKYGGSGLGLAISKHFCRMLGGDISVQSELGKGSTFTVTLPLQSKAAVSEISAMAQTLPADAKTILVIDDDPTVHDLMQRLLTNSGYQVLIANNGIKGIEMARTQQPDVITLDVMMPVMDGWSVLSALKADPATSEIPVVMMTMTSERNMAYALGASHFLMKPINREELSKVLSRYVGKESARALVVEDDPATRELLLRSLRQAGVSVHSAENGQVGLDWLHANGAPDLILLDLMMPVMDGFDFVAELRRLEQFQNVPVVVISAKDLTEADRARLTGCVDRVIAKGGLAPEDLLKLLGHYVQHSRTTRTVPLQKGQ